MSKGTRSLAFVLVTVVGPLLAGIPAHADTKIRKLVTFYKKEATVCAKHMAGLTSAKERAEPYTEDAEIRTDVGLLADAIVVVHDHCDAIEATLQLLQADPKATYKRLEVEIDKHETVVRASRAATRDALDDMAPVIQRLIPKVNKRRASS